jgi:hypothetical protein
MTAKRTDAPDTLAAQCAMIGIDGIEREYMFHPTRKWRFDLAIPARLVALECDGAIWTLGRHNRPSGWLKDQEKLNEAAILGWRVLHVTPQQVDSGEALGLVERIIKEEL